MLNPGTYSYFDVLNPGTSSCFDGLNPGTCPSFEVANNPISLFTWHAPSSYCRILRICHSWTHLLINYWQRGNKIDHTDLIALVGSGHQALINNQACPSTAVLIYGGTVHSDTWLIFSQILIIIAGSWGRAMECLLWIQQNIGGFVILKCDLYSNSSKA